MSPSCELVDKLALFCEFGPFSCEFGPFFVGENKTNPQRIGGLCGIKNRFAGEV